MKHKINASELAIGVLLIIAIGLVTLLSSCSESIIEPEAPTEYFITVTKDCRSCKLFYYKNSDRQMLGEAIKYAEIFDIAHSGDTITVTSFGIADDNNILYDLNSSITIHTKDSLYFQKEDVRRIILTLD